MNSYKFYTNEFGISDSGVHLLRSKYNYQTIEFKDITNMEIRNGKQLKNWIVIFVFGLSLIAFGLYYTMYIIYLFNNGQTDTIYIEQLIIPALPILLGCYSIYTSLKNGLIMRIEHKGFKTPYPLQELVNKKELDDFINYIKANKDLYFKVKISLY